MFDSGLARGTSPNTQMPTSEVRQEVDDGNIPSSEP